MDKRKGLCGITAIIVLWIVMAIPQEGKAEGGLPIAPLPPFNCQPYEYTQRDRATNVNEVRAHDVKVVMALGDSMTAAFAATAGPLLTEVPFIPREDRYLSFSGGGGALRYSLPNFLSVFNPSLLGGAVGETTPLDAVLEGGPVMKRAIGLNAAISGARVQGISRQIDHLVKELTTTYASQVDYQMDWKVATLLIGANNLCASCFNSSDNSPLSSPSSPSLLSLPPIQDEPPEVKFDGVITINAHFLNSSISHLYHSIPRVRLNILPMFNITQVYYWAQTDEYCKRVWRVLDECPCLSSRRATEADRRKVNENAVEYRKQLEQVVAFWQSLSLPSFAVSLQPFTHSLKITNRALVSSFDCFHPSFITQGYMGSMLWNSMMLPPDQKPVNVTHLLFDGIEFICPHRNSYLQ